MYWLYSKRVPENKYAQHVHCLISRIFIREQKAYDVEKSLFLHKDLMKASDTATSSEKQKFREPNLFFSNGAF